MRLSFNEIEKKKKEREKREKIQREKNKNHSEISGGGTRVCVSPSILKHKEKKMRQTSEEGGKH